MIQRSTAQVATLKVVVMCSLSAQVDSDDREDELAGRGNDAGDQNDVSPAKRCPLCLSVRDKPTATPCGHVFCWRCIAEWGNQKPECPLCRAEFTPSSLVCVYHGGF